ncbi:Papilin [Halotydeus destructor]|nr:Papilin [Halotydeus destructor]
MKWFLLPLLLATLVASGHGQDETDATTDMTATSEMLSTTEDGSGDSTPVLTLTEEDDYGNTECEGPCTILGSGDGADGTTTDSDATSSEPSSGSTDGSTQEPEVTSAEDADALNATDSSTEDDDLGMTTGGSDGTESTEVTEETSGQPEVDCATTEFGCCPDNVTIATSEGGLDCDEVSLDTNCTDSVGCENGTTVTAFAGSCQSSPFGCCPDNKSPAQGEQYYGCTCDQYLHGCCQDKYTPARGANFDGCSCDKMLYGCCQDLVTPAAGPDGLGCGCENTAHGCCPDNTTAATGPGLEGCPCSATPHGCCPDQQSVAQGPDSQGCPCHTMPWGCCPNSDRAATGPKYQGCSCVNTPFGCCQDGVSVAYGPKFESCPDGPPLETMLAAETCSLPKERGTCRNYTVKWYFDMQYGGCTRFWYGGCDGNGNRFNSQKECERVCVEPEGAESCSLPKVEGPCPGNYTSWYYSTSGRRCEQFNYGGCLGNKNRFDTRPECEDLCQHRPSADPCDQPVVSGPCRGLHQRWYYSRQDGRCRSFTYGGCQGNDNNFESEGGCIKTCGTLTPGQICLLPKAAGPCLGTYPRWHYDYIDSQCKEFTYTGCEGNRNRFVDKSTCENTCNKIHVQVPEDICSLEPAEGPCRKNIIRWYYNRNSARCDRFYYGGCDGNANNFEQREDCERSCVARTEEQNVCAQPREPGTCGQWAERWYFEVADRMCHRFYFSGCDGNGNNFGTRDECENRCGEPTTTQAPYWPVASQRPYYPTERPDDRDRYTPRPDDREVDRPVGPSPAGDDCVSDNDQGPCDNWERKWFYDRPTVFARSSISVAAKETEIGTRLERNAKTSAGTLRMSWYYDPRTEECATFAYSGCQGNANRFSGRETCENQCKLDRRRPTEDDNTVPDQDETGGKMDPGQGDPCQQPPEQGPCRGYNRMYYFRAADQSCVEFIYGGCGGNKNRFRSRKDCESGCLARPSMRPEEEPSENDPKKEVCLLEADAGQCSESHARWFYEPSSFTCLPFVFTGCGGNKNRFKTFEMCSRFCAGVRYEYTRPEERPPGPGGDDRDRDQGGKVVPADCPPPPNCEEQRCPFGIDQYQEENGCPTCRCSNPCYVHQCPDGHRCAIEVFRGQDGNPLAQPVCRLDNKPGQCPANIPDTPGEERDCTIRCRTDADCRDEDKCCNNGCADICVAPVKSDRRPEDSGHEEQVVVKEGYDVTLNCDTQAHFGRYVCWQRDGQQQCYHDNENRNVQLANGSLTIRQARRQDGGLYACRLEEAADSRVTRKYRLEVHEPARILPGPREVVAQVDQPAFFQCNAVGVPNPDVTWWRGFTMLPVASIRYQQFANFTLMIKRVGEADAGVYQCRAFNGVGDISVWDVALSIDVEPVMRPWESGVGYGERDPERDRYPDYNTPRDPYAQATPSTTTQAPLVPVTVAVRLVTPEYRVGSPLMLDCTADAYPSVNRVYWTLNQAPLTTDHRKYVMANNSLYISQLGRDDSGRYECHASNGYSDSSANVEIEVEDTYVPQGCNDSPYFSNCNMVIEMNFCSNVNYMTYCCKSCFLAKQIDRNQVNSVAKQARYRRRRVAVAVHKAKRALSRL